jgi:hypothetical protein
MSENFQNCTVPELQNGVPALEMLLQAGLARGTIAANCRRLSKDFHGGYQKWSDFHGFTNLHSGYLT